MSERPPEPGAPEPDVRGPAWPRPLVFAAALVVVALGAAAFAIAFRSTLGLTLRHAYNARDVVAAFRDLGPLARLLLPAFGGVAAGAIAALAARLGSGPAVGQVMEAVIFGRLRLSLPATALKSVASWLAISSGGSIGREGPIIQFGGAVGQTVARWLRIDDRRARILIAAGTAAGFAAAYNTPLAAILFVLEIVTGIVALDALLPTVVATALATAVTRAVVGGGPIYGERAFSIVSPFELVAHGLLGLLAALAAQLFMRALRGGVVLAERSKLPLPVRAGIGGLGVGLLALWLPEVTGNGFEPLGGILDGSLALSITAVLVLAKMLATTASVSSGSPGGVFTPTLLVGAAFGSCFGQALAAAFGPGVVGQPGSYALVGMAAAIAGATHAPLMAAVLVFELSGDYGIVLPLLVATSLSTLVSRRLHPDSLYTAEARRRGFAWTLTLEGRDVTHRGSQAPPE